MPKIPSHPAVGSLLCSAVAFALIAVGAAALLSAGVGEDLMRAAGNLQSAPIPAQLFAVVCVVAACAGAASTVFGTLALLWGLTLIFGVVMAFLAAIGTVGWALAAGFSPSPNLMAFGSPGPGLGSLAILSGIVALVWCRTAPAAEGPSWWRKIEVTAITAMFLVVVPGVIAFFHGQIQAELAAAVGSRVIQ